RQSQLASAIGSVIAERSAPPQPPALSEERAPRTVHTPRVLVVEDNVVNQKVAVGQLRMLGLDGHVAGSGAEALRMLGEGGYDLVLLDCQMPDLDGYEVAEEIRRIEQGT